MSKRRSHGSLYRRRRAGKLEDVWTIAYETKDGRRTERAFVDRRASEELLSQRLREAAREEVGLADPWAKHRRAPLSTHLEQFLAGVASRNRTEKHRRQLRARLRQAFDLMGATRLDQLQLDRGEAMLVRLLKEHGRSVKTRDHYAMTLRQFGAWLEDTDRVPRNPFRRLRGVSKASDVTRERLALTPDQVWRLVQAAEVRPVALYRKDHPQALPETLDRLAREGRRRGALYLFSALTGLRSAECAGIRWLDLDLTEGAAWVAPRAATTKAKRKERLPLDERLAAVLRDLKTTATAELARQRRRVLPGTAAVFHVPRHLPEQLRKDAAYAEVPLVDEHGRRLDFHALRATFGTFLARAGVPLQTGRRLVRHVDPKLTAKHYEKLPDDDLRRGSDLMGELFWREALAAEVTANAVRSDAEECEAVRNASRTRKDGTG